MRKRRRRSVVSRLFLLVALLLLVGCILVVLAFAEHYSRIPQGWENEVRTVLGWASRLLPDEASLRFLAWLAGIAASAVGAAFSLLATWHFAEMKLPQRLEDLKKSHNGDHLLLRPRFIALARRGLGSIPPDIETSRITLLRKWLSGWSEKEQARVLAASSNLLGKEALALSSATSEAQHKQITAHLIRGYQRASQGEDGKVFEEFESATNVRGHDIISRDIAAGWARKTNKQKEELELLAELQAAASATRADVHHARALRREAELLEKRQNEAAWSQARDRLDIAHDLLEPLLPNEEAKLELGRVLILFCEVQCHRRRVGHLLEGPNGRLTKLRNCMSGLKTHGRPEEPEGEQYGEERAERAIQRVAELRLDDSDPPNPPDPTPQN